MYEYGGVSRRGARGWAGPLAHVILRESGKVGQSRKLRLIHPARGDEPLVEILRVQAVEANAAGAGRCMDELAVTGVDADVRDVAARSEKHQVAGCQLVARDGLADACLFVGAARELDSDFAIDSIGEARAIDAVGGRSAGAIRRSKLSFGELDPFVGAHPGILCARIGEFLDGFGGLGVARRGGARRRLLRLARRLHGRSPGEARRAGTRRQQGSADCEKGEPRRGILRKRTTHNPHKWQGTCLAYANLLKPD